jgi:cellulose biosynthesis protein BcsQ
MQVVTLMNSKGGVGKTTLATTLGAGLAIWGYRVLLLDTDYQRHTITSALGIDKEPGFYELLVRGAAWNQIVRPVPKDRYSDPDHHQGHTGSLALLPGNIESRNVITASIEDAMLLYNRLLELVNRFDFVLIDTSPTPSLINALIYLASNALLYPTQLERGSLEGVAESFDYRQRYSDFREASGLTPIRALGIVPTMTNLGTNEHADNLKAVIDNPDDIAVWEPMHRRIIWAEAHSDQRSIFAYAPQHDAAKDGWRMVKRFLEAIHV